MNVAVRRHVNIFALLLPRLAAENFVISVVAVVFISAAAAAVAVIQRS